MRLHLVRHGHTDAVGTSLSGRSPVSLNVRGQAAARDAGRALVGRKITRVLSSPQLRTVQTAEMIGEALGLGVQTDAALDEIDFGNWTGAAFEVLDARPDWQAWNGLRSLAPSPGETMLSVQARVVALVQRLHPAHPDDDLVLVSHADVLKALLAHLLGMPLDLIARLELSPAGRSVAVLSGLSVRVEAINLPPDGP